MKNSFVRLIESTRDSVVCRLSHENSPGSCVYYSVMTFDRVSADLHITWDVNCPLSFIERVKAIFWFVRFISKL